MTASAVPGKKWQSKEKGGHYREELSKRQGAICWESVFPGSRERAGFLIQPILEKGSNRKRKGKN